jgi:hypothetical protein
MENYFNYFTEIEEHFWRKRGTAILLTSLDWALIDSWKQTAIPIEAVLRGIDRAFDKQEKRKAKMRRVNSLAYCHQAVIEAASEIERGMLPHESVPPPFPHEQLARYLAANAAAIMSTAEELRVKGRSESAVIMEEIANSLLEQAKQSTTSQRPDFQSLEQRMSLLEDKMLGVLRQTCLEDELVDIRMERDRQIAPFRSKMTSEQVRQLEAQFETRKLLESAGLPRLSLFYM